MTTTQKDTIVIYHANCADGLGAAWVCWKQFGENADYLPCKYGEDLLTKLLEIVHDGIYHHKNINIVDFSFPVHQLLAAAKLCKSITVIDHHETAQNDLVEAEIEWPDNVHINFDMSRSGAGMTWDFFNGNEHRPTFIDMIEDRDLWKFNVPRSKAFHKVLTTYTRNFVAEQRSFDFLNACQTDLQVFDGYLREGEMLLDYHDSILAHIMKDAFHKIDFDFPTEENGVITYCAGFINAPYFAASDIGELLGFGVDVVIIWNITDDLDKINVSFRTKTDSFNCGSFAKKYFNGGGHPKSAGGWCLIGAWLDFMQMGMLPLTGTAKVDED